MRLLLDTAILIWAFESPERLTRRAMAALETTGNILELSVVSLSEIAIKQARGKINLSASDTQLALKDLGIRILPYTADHAVLLFELPLYHKDPFDRQIVAQALSESIPIATPDEKFTLCEGLKIIW